MGIVLFSVLFSFILSEYDLCSRDDSVCVFLDSYASCSGCVNTLDEAFDSIPNGYGEGSSIIKNFTILSNNIIEEYTQYEEKEKFSIYIVANQTSKQNFNISNKRKTDCGASCSYGNRFIVSIEPYPGLDIRLSTKNERSPIIVFSNNSDWFSIIRFSSGWGKLSIENEFGTTSVQITKNNNSHLIFGGITFISKTKGTILPPPQQSPRRFIFEVEKNNNFFTYFQNNIFELNDTNGVKFHLFKFSKNYLDSCFEISHNELTNEFNGSSCFFLTVNDSRGFLNDNYFREVDVKFEFSFFKDEDFVEIRNNIFHIISLHLAARFHIYSSPEIGNTVRFYHNMFLYLDELGFYDYNQVSSGFEFYCNTLIGVESLVGLIKNPSEVMDNSTVLSNALVLSKGGIRPYPYYVFRDYQECPVNFQRRNVYPYQRFVDFLGRSWEGKRNSGPFVNSSVSTLSCDSFCEYPKGMCSDGQCICEKDLYAGKSCSCYLSAGYIYSSDTQTCVCNNTNNVESIYGVDQCKMSSEQSSGGIVTTGNGSSAFGVLWFFTITIISTPFICLCCSCFGYVVCICWVVLCYSSYYFILGKVKKNKIRHFEIDFGDDDEIFNDKDSKVSGSGSGRGGGGRREETMSIASSRRSIFSYLSLKGLKPKKGRSLSSRISSKKNSLSGGKVLDLDTLDVEMLVYKKNSGDDDWDDGLDD